MVDKKTAQPRRGQHLFSPTAATLHAPYYHQVDVAACNKGLAGERRATIEQLLTIPRAVKGLRLPTRIAKSRQQLPIHPRLRGSLG